LLSIIIFYFSSSSAHQSSVAVVVKEVIEAAALQLIARPTLLISCWLWMEFAALPVSDFTDSGVVTELFKTINAALRRMLHFLHQVCKQHCDRSA
jgi:hypothetical protein